MRREIMDLLKSPNESFRVRGWKDLLNDCVENQYVVSKNDFLFLASVLREEDNDDVYRYGNLALVQLVVLHLPEEPAGVPLVEWLKDWVWNPFHAMSAVLGTTEDQSPRDGTALIELARHLPRVEFPNTEIVQVPLNQPEWQAAFFQQKFEAICLVGRMGLFGTDAMRLWICKHTRFSFLTNSRPANLPPQALDEEYHCIVEQSKGQPTEYYRTSDDKDGMRTDYALVQRYVVEYGGKQLVVVYLAGNTALGTLGAALWAALQMHTSFGSNDTPIPCPPNVSQNTTVEALLEVRENISKPVWNPLVRLLKLTTADAIWSGTTGKWHMDITLRCENGDPRNSIGILFGSEEEPMNKGKQMFRLLASVCLLARQNPDGHIDLDELARDEWIWDGKKVEREVGPGQVAQLKFAHKKLQDLLVVESAVHLYANVMIENVPCVAVGVELPAQETQKGR